MRCKPDNQISRLPKLLGEGTLWLFAMHLPLGLALAQDFNSDSAFDLAWDGQSDFSMHPMSDHRFSDQLADPNLLQLESLQLADTLESSRRSARDMQTELMFKLSPGKFEFSRAGAFGLSGVFSNPELAVRSQSLNEITRGHTMPELHSGLSYSAGISIEHEDENISGTAYVSSGQLGVSYGRLGRVWYSGLDVSLGQFAGSHPLIGSSEVLSFDLTTGRRMGWTGIESDDPLWLLSLEGNFDMQSENGDKATGDDGDWYLNPSLFWQNPQFTFSAQLQVPVDSDLLRDSEEPDYKLRAVFEKHFR